MISRRYNLRKCIEDEVNDQKHNGNAQHPKHTKTERNRPVIANCILLDLPENVICEILSRLPLETIFSCKCVCKAFLEILRDPYFTKLHLTRASLEDHRLIIMGRRKASSAFMLHRLDLERISSFKEWKTLALPTVLSQDALYLNIVGSCNGLLCIHYLSQIDKIDNYEICVCNPILGEYIILPQPTPSELGANIVVGFGFCPKTKQYKVIRFVSALPCEIFTLGPNGGYKWRRNIGNIAPALEFLVFSKNSSLNGKLHWVATEDTRRDLNFLSKRETICVFDLETEQFSQIPLPSHFEEVTAPERSSMCIGILNGFLGVCCVVPHNQVEVYVMKQYSVKESWTKLIKICINASYGINENSEIELVYILSNSGLVFSYFGRILYYLSFLGGTAQNLCVRHIFSRTIGLVPSFISLRDIIAGEENVQGVQRKGLSMCDYHEFCCYNFDGDVLSDITREFF